MSCHTFHMQRRYFKAATEKLRTGETVQLKPKGGSMRGRVNEGDVVILALCNTRDLAVGDIVLARIHGRRYSHFVLHLIIERDGEQFLIGNNSGRADGWITSENIFGKVIEIKTSSNDK